MRPIVRQGARLASHSRASSCTRLRHPSIPRYAVRAFNSSTQRQTDARPPNNNGEHHDSSVEQRNDELRKSNEESTVKPEHAKDTENSEAKAANGEGRKPGLSRRTLRQRRATEVPRPPPIPDWFLKHNVSLVQDRMPDSAVEKDGSTEVLRCVDAETGHTLFTVPYYEPPPVDKRMYANVRGDEVDITALDLKDDIRRLPQHLREEMMIHHLQVQRARKPDEVDLEALGELLIALPRDMQEEILRREAVEGRREGRDETADYVPKRQATQLGKPSSRTVKRASQGSQLGQDFFNPKVAFQQPAAGAGSTKAPRTDSAASQRPTGPEASPFSWVRLEAETSIRSALALPTLGHNTSSFASSRVDISLRCLDNESHDQMDTFVNSLAQSAAADVIRLDSNDFEELTNDYVGQGHDSPGSFSTLGYDVFDGFVASDVASSSTPFGAQPPPKDEADVDEDEIDEDEDEDEADDHRMPPGGRNISDLRKALYQQRHKLGRALSDMGIDVQFGKPEIISVGSDGPRESKMRRSGRPSSDLGEYVQWSDDRLGALLDSLLDGPRQKRGTSAQAGDTAPQSTPGSKSSGKIDVSRNLVSYLQSSAITSGCPLKLRAESVATDPDATQSAPSATRTIVHIRDLKNLYRSYLGEAIVKRLVRVVRKRRAGGESVMIVGTTAQSHSDGVFLSMSSSSAPGDFPFRNITVPTPSANGSVPQDAIKSQPPMLPASASKLDEVGYPRILEINLRHVQSMLRRLRPDQDNIDLVSPKARAQMSLPCTGVLAEKVFSLDQVQRLVLIAIGLSQEYAQSNVVTPAHIALAVHITYQADRVVQSRSNDSASKLFQAFGVGGQSDSVEKPRDEESRPSRVDRIKGSCNPHETRLLTGVIDVKNIKTGFADVHAPTETIDALKTLTSLSLLRPEAFSYGVLAADRLPGLLLYGPPGTGKTLLAKAVAKESKATVLEISGAQIYEKYVGEGEKMVRAVFSLAKKLSPCVVFVDEADAIFGSRSGAGSRNTHREIINQFLREWDGMDDHSVFMMVASNRPFDLDDAVLRRLPRRLLVDLPVAKDRESILGIHLKNELLDSSVSLANLAEQTPLYSGSDLKNLCVSAALACVREENELLTARRKEDKDFKLPEKRTLTGKHFETAVKEISASISEDMSSLTAIRKFDEQFGDRRGRRKKAGFGFGKLDGAVDEMSVRVRQAEGGSPPAP